MQHVDLHLDASYQCIDALADFAQVVVDPASERVLLNELPLRIVVANGWNHLQTFINQLIGSLSNLLLGHSIFRFQLSSNFSARTGKNCIGPILLSNSPHLHPHPPAPCHCSHGLPFRCRFGQPSGSVQNCRKLLFLLFDLIATENEVLVGMKIDS